MSASFLPNTCHVAQVAVPYVRNSSLCLQHFDSLEGGPPLTFSKVKIEALGFRGLISHALPLVALVGTNEGSLCFASDLFHPDSLLRRSVRNREPMRWHGPHCHCYYCHWLRFQTELWAGWV